MTQKEQAINGVLTELGHLPLEIQLAVFKELFTKFNSRIGVQIHFNDIVETPTDEDYVQVDELDSMLTPNYDNYNQQEFVDNQPLQDYIEPLN